ncbi:MAG: Uncharacterised protein [Methanobacteriota archaeon]|nr:MAG: Uncharacterised protein [Euryarchaeota archaeon]
MTLPELFASTCNPPNTDPTFVKDSGCPACEVGANETKRTKIIAITLTRIVSVIAHIFSMIALQVLSGMGSITPAVE